MFFLLNAQTDSEKDKTESVIINIPINNVLATNGGFDYDNEGQLYNNSYSQNYLYHLKYFWVTR